MTALRTKIFILFLASAPLAWAWTWTPKVHERTPGRLPPSITKQASFDPLDLASKSTDISRSDVLNPNVAFLMSAALLGSPSVASAATAFSPNGVPSALADYGHYFGLLGVGCFLHPDGTSDTSEFTKLE